MAEERGHKVTLEEVLMQRESRAAKALMLLSRYPGRPVVCLLVNKPGPVKRTAAGDTVFAAGYAALHSALEKAGMPILHCESERLITGCEAYLVPDADANAVKRLTCALESDLPYGRLLDIDVHAPDGSQVSRTALAFPERGCMVCGKPGAYCASRRIHGVPELCEAFERLAASAEEQV